MSTARKRPTRNPVNPQELPPARGRLVFDPQQCRTCRVCEVTCAIVHEGQARPSLARINIFFDEFAEISPISASFCLQCEDAPCIEACRLGAMSRDPRTGAVLINEELCVGCMLCQRACPWDIPKLHPEKKIAIKCDLCSDRPEGPACVQACPLAGKALRYDPDYYVRGAQA